MSDSSLGDSLFSYQSNRRYFGSTESCRFGFECRRCSLDGDKCSYSDNCRHGDRCRNCDCSSSYFSSDFDDTQNFSRRSSTRYSTKSNTQQQQHQTQHNQYHDKYFEQKTTRYAEDFIKHVNNVKYNNQLGGDDNLVLQQQQQSQRKIQHLYETIGDKGLVGGGTTNATTPSKRGRGIGSTSTVEYSSSSDTAMLGSGSGGRGKYDKSSTRSRSKTEDTTLSSYKSTHESSHMTNESNLENKKYATINNVSNTKKSSNEAITAGSTTKDSSSSSTMKRRRNKTTGTIPKLNTFDSSTTTSTTIQQQRMQMSRHENNRSEMNLSQYRANDLYSSIMTGSHQQLGKLKRYQSDDIDRSNDTKGVTKFQTIEQLEHHTPTTTTTTTATDNSITERAVGGDKAKGDENLIIYEKGSVVAVVGRDNDKNPVKQSVGDDDEVFVNNLTYEMPPQSNRRVSTFLLSLTRVSSLKEASY